MRTWIVKLNGRPLLTISGPSYIDPVMAARDILMQGQPANEQIGWSWL